MHRLIDLSSLREVHEIQDRLLGFLEAASSAAFAYNLDWGWEILKLLHGLRGSSNDLCLGPHTALILGWIKDAGRH